MDRGGALRTAIVAGLLVSALSAHAARPLDTEDAGTVAPGRVELELGQELWKLRGDRLYRTTGVLSVGLAAGVEARVESAAVAFDPDDAPARGGAGDSLVGLKVRLWNQTADRPAALAAFTLGVPTGSHRRRLGTDPLDPGALLVASKIFGDFNFEANAGYTALTRDRRRDFWTLAGAVEYAAPQGFVLVSEAFGGVGARHSFRTLLLRGGVVRSLGHWANADVALAYGVTSDTPEMIVRVGVTLPFP